MFDMNFIVNRAAVDAKKLAARSAVFERLGTRNVKELEKAADALASLPSVADVYGELQHRLETARLAESEIRRVGPLTVTVFGVMNEKGFDLFLPLEAREAYRSMELAMDKHVTKALQALGPHERLAYEGIVNVIAKDAGYDKIGAFLENMLSSFPAEFEKAGVSLIANVGYYPAGAKFYDLAVPAEQAKRQGVVAHNAGERAERNNTGEKTVRSSILEYADSHNTFNSSDLVKFTGRPYATIASELLKLRASDDIEEAGKEGSVKFYRMKKPAVPAAPPERAATYPVAVNPTATKPANEKPASSVVAANPYASAESDGNGHDPGQHAAMDMLGYLLGKGGTKYSAPVTELNTYGRAALRWARENGWINPEGNGKSFRMTQRGVDAVAANGIS
jgi:hypothetical protein